MYVKKSNFVIFLALAIVVGFGVGILINGLGPNAWPPEGSIAKAARYNNQKEDPMMTVIEERLMNDEEFLDDTRSTMSFLQNRMAVLSGLAEETIAACEGLPEFEPLMDEMRSINARSYNTASAMENAGKSLDKIAEGKKAPEYEMYSNQAYIGFCKVGNQMELGRKFCQTAADFLEGKDEEEYPLIAYLATVWEMYCMQDEQMFADREHSKPAADSTPDLNPLNVPGMPGGRNPRLTGPGQQVADNRHQTDTVIPGGNPIVTKYPPKGGQRFGNSTFVEYLKGNSTGEYLKGANAEHFLQGVDIFDAFPDMRVMDAPSISEVVEIQNTSEQTIGQGQHQR